jgi:3'5'-cyclic nucleotide phosphodiesterase/Adenylate and Guanylate cyclase catalytic domain
LRGEKARFQLFGDTVNTASRMESSGIPGKIQISSETAALLDEAGKSHWVVPRDTPVLLKGKGELQTFFASPVLVFRDADVPKRSSSLPCADSCPDEAVVPSRPRAASLQFTAKQPSGPISDKMCRLVSWNVEVLYSHLLKVVASRQGAVSLGAGSHGRAHRPQVVLNSVADPSHGTEARSFAVDEMTDILKMPPFPKQLDDHERPEALVSSIVKDQLRDFVSRISLLYRDVPFHNFDHASHVIMSAGKLMSRIMSPDGVDHGQGRVQIAHTIHDMTYGISSDPLMQFSVVFAALIHDVDHTGLTNKELMESQSPMAGVYSDKSIAEQRSIDVAWSVLLEARFDELRKCIGSTDDEFARFRQLIVNAVLATD